MMCELCGKEHDGSYGSGRFCSSRCARSFSTSKNRKEISLKVSKTLRSKCSSNKNLLDKELAKSKVVYHKKLDKIKQGVLFAESIGLKDSPYSEYNVATVWKLVEGREAYRLCLYDGIKFIKGTVVLVHRYKMEKLLGRKLTKDEVVHHIDGNKFNNDISNLVVMSVSEHSRKHAIESGFRNNCKGRDPWNKGRKGCYSEESLRKMSESAKNRHKNNK